MTEPQDPVEILIEDPTTGETHTFTGPTEEAATAGAEAFFGSDIAEENTDD